MSLVLRDGRLDAFADVPVVTVEVADELPLVVDRDVTGEFLALDDDIDVGRDHEEVDLAREVAVLEVEVVDHIDGEVRVPELEGDLILAVDACLLDVDVTFEAPTVGRSNAGEKGLHLGELVGGRGTLLGEDWLRV